MLRMNTLLLVVLKIVLMQFSSVLLVLQIPGLRLLLLLLLLFSLIAATVQTVALLAGEYERAAGSNLLV